MGRHAYWYFAPYQSDINAVLKTLQRQEFEAGRYNPVNPFPFNPDLNERCKSKDASSVSYASIQEALEASGECGTRSILDMCNGVSDKPDSCTVSPYPLKYLLKFFGSDKPSLQAVEAVVFEGRYPESNDESEVDEKDPEYGYVYDWFEVINRGECKYIVIYEGDKPSEIYFNGCSFD
jgi:hypothetical protein